MLALLVTFLWSTSFIIIKIGLKEIPPLTFAALRYLLAFLTLMPFLFKSEYVAAIKNFTRNDWLKLTALGLIFYTFTQGAQFIGLSLLPSVTVSLLLNFTPIVVAIMGIFFLKEYPGRLQWIGAFLFLAGILTYFYPVNLSESHSLGILVMIFGVLANAASSILGRSINRSGKFHPLLVTVISMGIGSLILIIVSLFTSGLPVMGLTNILFLIWLAIINTAFAFTLWNSTLRTLSAMESSIINGTMLVQIGLLAWIFLGETITPRELAGMIIAIAGALLVQIKRAG